MEKAVDVYGLTAKRLLHGGDKLKQISPDIINSFYRQGAVKSCMKMVVLTQVYKKKKDYILKQRITEGLRSSLLSQKF